jgi:hypothetical protein
VATRIGGRQLVAVLDQVAERRAQVREVEHQHAVLVRELEHQGQYTFLRVVEIQQAGQQLRPHFAQRCPDRCALLGEQVPERDGVGMLRVAVDADVLNAFVDLRVWLAGLRESRQIAFHVSEKDGHSEP